MLRGMALPTHLPRGYPDVTLWPDPDTPGSGQTRSAAFSLPSLVGAEQRTQRSLVIDEAPSLPRTECKAFGIRLRRGI
jgi:hypothetical protein